MGAVMHEAVEDHGHICSGPWGGGSERPKVRVMWRTGKGLPGCQEGNRCGTERRGTPGGPCAGCHSALSALLGQWDLSSRLGHFTLGCGMPEAPRDPC